MVFEKQFDQGEELLSLKELIEDSRKIVIKIGSNTLSTEKGEVNLKAMHNIVEQLVEWMKLGEGHYHRFFRCRDLRRGSHQ